ncbi:uncharacterized protein [Rutidosis leptorrhynchoides]|uniref:uncharacterized protein n=1 Tax=Rutidosis leptorrhynchoides TaxID=125765 RepID=UPI003A9A3D1B
MTWINWNQVLAPFNKGGLNVGSLNAFNLALLLKWKWRFLIDDKALWVKVIKSIHGDGVGHAAPRLVNRGVWSSICSSWHFLHDQNIISNHVFQKKIGDGSNTKLWKDMWLGDCSLTSKFNVLFALEIDSDCKIADRFFDGAWHWNWSRPLTSCCHLASLEELNAMVSSFSLSENADSRLWSMSKEGIYRVKDGRRIIDDHCLPSIDHQTRWVSTLPRKVDIFVWRVDLDKLPSRLNLSKKGLEIPRINCSTCGFCVESTNHALFECQLLVKYGRGFNFGLM